MSTIPAHEFSPFNHCACCGCSLPPIHQLVLPDMPPALCQACRDAQRASDLDSAVVPSTRGSAKQGSAGVAVLEVLTAHQLPLLAPPEVATT
jgi:hypothetical protein